MLPGISWCRWTPSLPEVHRMRQGWRRQDTQYLLWMDTSNLVALLNTILSIICLRSHLQFKISISQIKCWSNKLKILNCQFNFMGQCHSDLVWSQEMNITLQWQDNNRQDDTSRHLQQSVSTKRWPGTRLIPSRSRRWWWGRLLSCHSSWWGSWRGRWWPSTCWRISQS